MFDTIRSIRHSLALKVMLTAGVILLLGMSAWAYFSIGYQERTMMDKMVQSTDRLSNTIKLGTHYAMMLDARRDIAAIIGNVSRQPDIVHVRIYNKRGEIKFSNEQKEIDKTTNIEEQACYICHEQEPPKVRATLDERTRFYRLGKASLMGVISPIYNEPSCSADPCHVHPADKEVLGLLDVVVSLNETEATIAGFTRNTLLTALMVFAVTFMAFILFIIRFVKSPIQKLITGTQLVAQGRRFRVDLDQDDEIGRMAEAFNRMARDVTWKQNELNKQRNEFQNLFEGVPCIVTVVDRDYRLVRYNREFAEKFDPTPRDYCYHAWKSRDSRCDKCPVAKTFTDGLPHVSEETGYNKDGTRAHWIVTTSPIRDEEGHIVAAMEMCLDITRRKRLEEDLEKSERKYLAIFDNIPNAVFVLDGEDLTILDCNDSVESVYGRKKSELLGQNFLHLFRSEERSDYDSRIRACQVIDQATQLKQGDKPIYVTIRVSPTDFPDRTVLLVTTSDITKRLETEQQLIQASKMATLGEMATGVAHELNQPLSVIKTASSYFMRKIRKNEPVKEETLSSLAQEIDAHVDRAAKIINHMREFGRKPDLKLEQVDVNTTLRRAFDIFSQQLKLREIDVVWELDDDLPHIMGESSRLEQVFINLLINARDAIEDRWRDEARSDAKGNKRIILRSRLADGRVQVDVCDTGTGIPEQSAEKLFEPFFTTKEVGKGTGLGLSISYGIVHDYDGTIRADNWSEGACFRIDFPLRKHPGAEPAPAAEE